MCSFNKIFPYLQCTCFCVVANKGLIQHGVQQLHHTIRFQKIYVQTNQMIPISTGYGNPADERVILFSAISSSNNLRSAFPLRKFFKESLTHGPLNLCVNEKTVRVNDSPYFQFWSHTVPPPIPIKIIMPH